MTASTNPRRRLRRTLAITGAVPALGLVAVAALALTGLLPVPGSSAHPPCDELPGAAEVERALAAHPDLVAELTAVGDGVDVRAASPGCDDPDRTLVEITFRTEDEFAAVEAVLTEADGFGVPVFVREA
ncbi:hypothetical protein [Glycomyces terrestris]|uniref:Uncharacterized protein n=1 Tax=Glycomyces terrestris TaxID=2493553 RepID=A0A426V3N2_9ACTN|nr:hypothetical protein [Glycomyces terrestris]RRS01524.1 hypothetical protein EIW28_01785 [Glycomyces terrestris]